MSRASGSNSVGLSNGNPTAGVGTVSVSSPSGGRTRRRSARGNNSSDNSGGSASNSISTTVDILSLFECPVCFDYVLPPILQCHSGHFVCNTCRPQLDWCPTCRGPLENIRNLAMDKVALTVMFPCKYSSSGCRASLMYTEKIAHEEQCESRQYKCPFPGTPCLWEGGLEQVLEHLSVVHSSITTLEGDEVLFLATDINNHGNAEWAMIQSCFGHHFMIILKKQENYEGRLQYFAVMEMIGSRRQCTEFVYKLELKRRRRRLTWESSPRSLHEDDYEDHFVFDASTAEDFAKNGNLSMSVTIYERNVEAQQT